ncbi:hypothetical protein DMENIID0001_131750 [Sergentomyia squamirostris]
MMMFNRSNKKSANKGCELVVISHHEDIEQKRSQGRSSPHTFSLRSELDKLDNFIKVIPEAADGSIAGYETRKIYLALAPPAPPHGSIDEFFIKENKREKGVLLGWINLE